MIFKKQELSHLWPFYLYLLVFGLSLMIGPFMIFYYLDLGFSYFQISIIMSSFGFSMFLFEIPTGAFADGYSRKYSVILGSLIAATSISLIPFTVNFYLLIALWSMAGIGTTFISGAEEAWVIDNLNKVNRKDLHQEYFIKSGSFISLGAIVAPFLGAILVKLYSVKILWFVLGMGHFISALIMLFFAKELSKPVKVKPMEVIRTSYRNSIKGLKFSMNHKTILLSIIAGLFMQMMFFGNIGIPSFLVSLGMKEYQLGYLSSIIAAVCIGASFLSRSFSHYKPKNVLSSVIMFMMILLLSLIFIPPPYFYIAAIVFILIEGVQNFSEPISQAYFHEFIPEKIRATVISTRSMIGQLVIGLTTMISGIFIDFFGPQKVLAFSGLLGIIAVFCYQKIKD